MRGEHETVDGQVAGGFVPVVDADRADDGCSRHGGHVLGFALVAVPGADEALSIVGDGVKALHAVEVEVVDEAQLAAIVGSQASGQQDRFGGSRVSVDIMESFEAARTGGRLRPDPGTG